MRFARSLFNLTLVAVGGILGNLVAAWVQQDAWGNVFTPLRLALTVVGFVIVLVVLALLDARASAGTSAPPGLPSPPGASRNRQIGARNLIRVLTGTNAVGNWQVGAGNRIEVIDPLMPDRDFGPAAAPADRRASLQRQRDEKQRMLLILEEQLAGFPRGSEPPEKLRQAQQVREDIRSIERELDGL